ncbi:unnamed protein product [Dibothriocephalus latus]|uniref:Uncharacterized protein n=1 Tax=Dibothriocephalus latus TaxID=60516 RepID=A0A3P7M9K4_DIBLA|nr:unnamed protein product [Dibothriocephalus latus]
MIASDDGHIKKDSGVPCLTQSQLLAVTARSLAEEDASSLFDLGSEPERSKFVKIFQARSVELETAPEASSDDLSTLLKCFFAPH